jgi:hypothetical protein
VVALRLAVFEGVEESVKDLPIMSLPGHVPPQ